jgi:hypothetical protein
MPYLWVGNVIEVLAGPAGPRPGVAQIPSSTSME